jgi:hypothetical protein
VGEPSLEVVRSILSERDEAEAFARILYTAFGGFVDWDLLPADSRSKDEYREKAKSLLKFLALHREQHGKVTAPIEPTHDMIEAGYRAMLAARPRQQE